EHAVFLPFLPVDTGELDQIVLLRPVVREDRQRLDDLRIVLELEVEHVQELIPALLDVPSLLTRDLDRALDRRNAFPILLKLIVNLRLQDVWRRSRILGTLEPLLQHREPFIVLLLLNVELRERELRVLLEADRQIR